MRRKAPPIPAHMLEPGYFTELVRQHNWPPLFRPSVALEDEPPRPAAQTALAVREHQAQTGQGWGSGTVVMGRTPKNARPMWIARAR